MSKKKHGRQKKHLTTIPHSKDVFLFFVGQNMTFTFFDLWAFSRKGKLGGSAVFVGGSRGPHSPNVSKNCEKVGQKTAMLEKWSRFIL